MAQALALVDQRQPGSNASNTYIDFLSPVEFLLCAMGARLSRPRGPGGTGEASTVPPSTSTPKRPINRAINNRTIVAPAAAFTMALILFVYTRTSIRAAKANAQRHRQADTGGEGLSLLNEDRRRHGLEPKLDQGGNNTVTQLASEVRQQLMGARKSKVEEVSGKVGGGRSRDEERLRQLTGKSTGPKD